MSLLSMDQYGQLVILHINHVTYADRSCGSAYLWVYICMSVTTVKRSCGGTVLNEDSYLVGVLKTFGWLFVMLLLLGVIRFVAKYNNILSNNNVTIRIYNYGRPA